MDTVNPYESPLALEDDVAESTGWVQILAPMTLAAGISLGVWVALLIFVGVPLSRWPFGLPCVVGVPCIAGCALTVAWGTRMRGWPVVAVAIGIGLAIGIGPIAAFSFCPYPIANVPRIGSADRWFMMGIGVLSMLINLVAVLVVSRWRKRRASKLARTTARAQA